ncbi:MAG: ribonuclease HI family protein [Patescibacteria group bacterium]
MNKVIIYTDGGARNNPGPAGIGVVLYDEKKKIMETYKEYIGEATNNQAEYRALLKGLELAEKYMDSRLRRNDKGVEIECFLDSELVVKQLNKEYKVKDPDLQVLYSQILDLVIFKNISFKHVKREQNKLADKLVNEAIDEA